MANRDWSRRPRRPIGRVKPVRLGTGSLGLEKGVDSESLCVVNSIRGVGSPCEFRVRARAHVDHSLACSVAVAWSTWSQTIVAR